MLARPNPVCIARIALLTSLMALATAALVGCLSQRPDQSIGIADPALLAPSPRTMPTPQVPSDPARPTQMTVTSLGRVSQMVPLWDALRTRISLAGCGREVVGYQFSLVAPPAGLSNVRVSLSDLDLVSPRGANRLRRQTMDLFRVTSIRVSQLPAWHQIYETTTANRATADFPDALVPSDNARLGQPWSLSAGEVLTLWVDVPVPADQTPGRYEGRVTVTADNAPEAGFTVRLDVLPVNLPADASIQFLAPVDVKQMLGRELDRAELSDAFALGQGVATTAKRVAQWVELGRAHGVQFLPADLAPVFKRGLNGAMAVDWAGYDRVVGPTLTGASAPPVWLAPFRGDYPDPALYGGLKAKPYTDLASQYLRALGSHGREARWPQPIVWMHRDRPRETTLPYGQDHWRDWLTDTRRAESIAFGDVVFRVEMNFGYLDSLPWPLRRAAEPPEAPARPTGRPPRQLPPHVTIYCPSAEFLDPAGLPTLVGEGAKVWVGEGGPPWRPSVDLFARPEQIEAFAYIAHRYGTNTVWLGPVQRWPARSPLAAPVPAEDAHFLFYSGPWFEQDRPVASVRLKHLRTAAQNAAYLRLLSELRRRTQADAIAGAMVKYAFMEASTGESGLGGAIGWQQEGVLYGDARLMLRQELLLAANRAGPADRAAAQSRLLWANFHERTAWVRLLAYPGQLVDVPDAFGAIGGQLRAVFRLEPWVDRAAVAPTVPGESPGDIQPLRLGFGSLPKTWKPARFNVPIESAPPGVAGVLTLAADGVELPIDKAGAVTLPLTMTGRPGSEPIAAVVPVLPAHSFRQAPQIDGKLGEWPTANWFRGSNFRRLSLGEPTGLFAQPAPAVLDTWFMAGHDADNLYLAVACLGQKPGEVSARYANNIQQDRGLIVGEDAVEIVLDPTGGRLDRQGLFHLAVKPTGTVIGWRGMTGPRNAGPPEMWGRGVRAEVSFQPAYWLLEVSIPKGDLGAVNTLGLWRINVARHVAVLGEHSAWASSSPMLGEPESLGNLLLRAAPLPRHEVEVIPPVPGAN